MSVASENSSRLIWEAPVPLSVPSGILTRLFQILFGVLKHPAGGYKPFGNQINAFNLAHGGNLRVGVVKAGADLLFQIFRCQDRGRTAADDVLSFLGKEKRHHFGYIPPGRRAVRS